MKEVAVGRFRYSVPAAVAFALLIVGVSATSTFAQTAGNGAQVTVTGTGGSGVNFRVTPGGAAIGSLPGRIQACGRRSRPAGDRSRMAERSFS